MNEVIHQADNDFKGFLHRVEDGSLNEKDVSFIHSGCLDRLSQRKKDNILSMSCPLSWLAALHGLMGMPGHLVTDLAPKQENSGLTMPSELLSPLSYDPLLRCCATWLCPSLKPWPSSKAEG